MSTKTIKIENCQGYIWKSDAPKPEKVYSNELCELTLDESENPFIVEGLLTDGKNKSVHIKYIDGKYLITNFEWGKLSNEYTEQKFIAHRIENVSKLIFRQYWKSKIDSLCEGMETLQPAELVFVGFETKENKEGK